MNPLVNNETDIFPDTTQVEVFQTSEAGSQHSRFTVLRFCNFIVGALGISIGTLCEAGTIGPAKALSERSVFGIPMLVTSLGSLAFATFTRD